MTSHADVHRPPSTGDDPGGIQRILQARAEDLARSPETETLASETVEVVAFAVGDEQFAIETRYVTEVLRNAEITPLPGDNRPLVGVTNLRGELLAVMSLASVLEIHEEPSSAESGGLARTWVLVAGVDQPQFGIAAASVKEVAALASECVLDPSRQTSISNVGFVRGVTEEARIIIDGQALLDDQRFVIDTQES